MTASVTPSDLRRRAGKLFDREARTWASGSHETAVLSVPLHPPTEREVLVDAAGAITWVRQWRTAEASFPVEVTWAVRDWARVGRQAVPERASITGAAAIAEVAGCHDQWKRWAERVAWLRADLETPENSDAVVVALRRHARTVGELADVDYEILRNVTLWLVRHPVSGLRIRQLPIRGIDTKWMERHRTVVESLVAATTGTASLGLVAAPERVRIRVLDPELRPGGLVDITAPLEDLARLVLAPACVLIVENLETLFALPDTSGVVAVHGSGYVGHLAARVPWITQTRALYWGDLDSHGFAILSRVRGAGLDAESVLMDAETLHEFRDLWVIEPSPSLTQPTHLTDDERAVFAALRAEGNVRLEQERISWDYALARLAAAFARGDR